MKNSHVWLIGILLAVSTPATVLGKIYKSINPDGSIAYSDQPRKDATVVDLLPEPPPPPAKAPVAPPAAAAPAPTGTPPAPGATAEQPAFTGYTSFAILTPENDSTVRENSGSVAVILSIEPVLYTEGGHKISLLMDGKPVLEGLTAPQIQLANVDRGTHTIEAQVFDSTGALLATSNPVTFHLKRISTLMLKESPLLAPHSSAPAPMLFPRAPQAPF